MSATPQKKTKGSRNKNGAVMVSFPQARAGDTADAETQRVPPVDDLPRGNILTPTMYDVLCGQGGESNNHAGNRGYLQLVEANKQNYRDAAKGNKKQLSEIVIACVKRGGHLANAKASNSFQGHQHVGRFLKKCPVNGRWFEIDHGAALDKVSQAFREGKLRGTPVDAQDNTLVIPGERLAHARVDRNFAVGHELAPTIVDPTAHALVARPFADGPGLAPAFVAVDVSVLLGDGSTVPSQLSVPITARDLYANKVVAPTSLPPPPSASIRACRALQHQQSVDPGKRLPSSVVKGGEDSSRKKQRPSEMNTEYVDADGTCWDPDWNTGDAVFLDDVWFQ
jgi:hypothetical protein